MDKLVNTVSKATGWTTDFTTDVLATGGAALIAAWVVGLTPLANVPFAPLVIVGIVSAMVWKRMRRDNR